MTKLVCLRTLWCINPSVPSSGFLWHSHSSLWLELKLINEAHWMYITRYIDLNLLKSMCLLSLMYNYDLNWKPSTSWSVTDQFQVMKKCTDFTHKVRFITQVVLVKNHFLYKRVKQMLFVIFITKTPGTHHPTNSPPPFLIRESFA